MKIILLSELCTQLLIGRLTLAAIFVLAAMSHTSAQGSGTMTTAINIQDFSFTPSTVDVTNTSPSVIVSVRVTDTERDFWSMSVAFRSPQGIN
ncbi:MAG: hypothetical protein ABIU09_07510, partial [Pyrinomonadaceae bacterium]